MPDLKTLSPFILRAALPQDLENCVKLALEIPKEMDAEEADLFPLASEEDVRAKFEELIPLNTLLIYENNGVPVGILGVSIHKFWWSAKPVMTDVILYIRPEFRSNSAFTRLLSVAEEFAKINRLPLCLLFFTTKDLMRKLNLLKRRGYKTVGFWMMKK